MTNLSGIIFLKNRGLTKLIFFALSDAILILGSVFLAFLVRFEGMVPEIYFLNIWTVIILTWFITLPVFYFFRLYHFTWRYVSAEELVELVKGTVLSFLFIILAFFVLRDEPAFSGFPRSTLFISYFFIFILIGFLRFAKRIYLITFPFGKKENKERTLIVGAGDAGELLLRNILSVRNSPYDVVGFIDDAFSRQGALIHGLSVLGRIKDIPKIARNNKIESLIIAMPSVDARVIQSAVEKGREARLRKIKIVPPIEEVMAGRVTLGHLQEVAMDDLLDRELVSLDEKLVEHFIKDKRVLVTGAAGSIGFELCRQIAKFKPASLMLLDQDETGIFNISEELEDRFPRLNKIFQICDIRDKGKIESVFKEFSPQIIFHAAAYKHVPLMEKNPDEAVKNNIFGTKIVAEAVLKQGAETFIFISTDKAINPTSIMGATKRAGEMICSALQGQGKTKFVSVRFGNVLDSRGSVVPIFREKIKKREPIEITHPEMKRYFMVTAEACLLVMMAGAMGKGGEVFVLDMGDPIEILELAKRMIRLSGLEPDKDIPIVFTEVRPGEKLFEEILSAEEGILTTKHQRIFIAKLTQVEQSKLGQSLEKLKLASDTTDKKAIIEALTELIPAYRHG